MILLQLTTLTAMFFATTSLPIDKEKELSKRFFPFTFAPASPPTAPPDSNDTDGFYFRIHRRTSVFLGNVKRVRFNNMHAVNSGSYVAGQGIDLADCTITTPVNGFYYFHIAIKATILSSNISDTDKIVVTFCSGLHCDFDTGILYHAVVPTFGNMIIDAFRVVKLEEGIKIKIYIEKPKHLYLEINSNTYVDGLLIKEIN